MKRKSYRYGGEDDITNCPSCHACNNGITTVARPVRNTAYHFAYIADLDPDNPDFDDDGVPDGFTAEGFQAHRLFTSGEGVTVRPNFAPALFGLNCKYSWELEPQFMTNYVSIAHDSSSVTVFYDNAPPSMRSFGIRAAIGSAGNEFRSTQSIVTFCDGRDDYPTNRIDFASPHTNATIHIEYGLCDHPFPDDASNPEYSIEVEAGRDTLDGWQHLAWIDTDPASPGFQKRTPVSRNSPPTLSWNVRSDVSTPISDGVDSLLYLYNVRTNGK